MADMANGPDEPPNRGPGRPRKWTDNAERARSLRWPTVDRLGGHLDTANYPDRIAGIIVELAS